MAGRRPSIAPRLVLALLRSLHPHVHVCPPGISILPPLGTLLGTTRLPEQLRAHIPHLGATAARSALTGRRGRRPWSRLPASPCSAALPVRPTYCSLHFSLYSCCHCTPALWSCGIHLTMPLPCHYHMPSHGVPQCTTSSVLPAVNYQQCSALYYHGLFLLLGRVELCTTGAVQGAAENMRDRPAPCVAAVCCSLQTHSRPPSMARCTMAIPPMDIQVVAQAVLTEECSTASQKSSVMATHIMAPPANPNPMGSSGANCNRTRSGLLSTCSTEYI
jgi:hypothetical protein